MFQIINKQFLWGHLEVAPGVWSGCTVTVKQMMWHLPALYPTVQWPRPSCLSMVTEMLWSSLLQYLVSRESLSNTAVSIYGILLIQTFITVKMNEYWPVLAQFSVQAQPHSRLVSFNIQIPKNTTQIFKYLYISHEYLIHLVKFKMNDENNVRSELDSVIIQVWEK